MDFNFYSQMALSTLNPECEDVFLNGILGLVGETGEIVDYVKKCMFQGHERDDAHIIGELGDVLWYINLLAFSVGVTLEDVAVENLVKLAKRYKKGFSVEDSIRRSE